MSGPNFNATSNQPATFDPKSPQIVDRQWQIDGSTDEVQLVVQANFTQSASNPIAMFTDSSLTPYFAIGNVGQLGQSPGTIDSAPFPGMQAVFAAATLNDNSTAASGVAAAPVTAFSFAAPTVTASNSNVTTNYAATVYIDGAPIASTNQTIPSLYSLWVAAGIARFDGQFLLSDYSDTTGPTTAAGEGAIFIGSDNNLYYRPQANGSAVQLNGGGGSSPWQTTSNVVNLGTSTDTVTIGSSTALGKLAVDGDADEVQLLVQGHSTQISNLAVFEDSAGTDLVTISGTGSVSITDTTNEAAFAVASSVTNITGTSFDYNSLTSGFGMTIGALDSGLTSGSLLFMDVTDNAVNTGWNGSMLTLSSNRSVTGASLTVEDTDATLSINRNLTVNNGTATYTDDGGALQITVTGTETSGTLNMGTTGIGISMTGVNSNARAMRVGGAPIELEDIDIVLGTTTGTKIGTATSEKLGFYNSTPIIQPSATGETTGFTAGAGTGVNDDSTFTGNVGSTAYRISDVVKHLKNLGLIAA